MVSLNNGLSKQSKIKLWFIKTNSSLTLVKTTFSGLFLAATLEKKGREYESLRFVHLPQNYGLELHLNLVTDCHTGTRQQWQDSLQYLEIAFTLGITLYIAHFYR